MTTSLLALALGIVFSLATITLSDFSNLVNHQELAFARANHLAEQLINQCADNQCALPPGTQACTIGGHSLQTKVEIPWNPQLWKGRTPAQGTYTVTLALADQKLLSNLNLCRN